MGEDQTAVKSWINYLNSEYPNAIWIGTQEPTHTTGFSVTSSTSDPQALALVRSTAPKKAYVAVWNVSANNSTYNFSVDLYNLNSSFTTSNLTIQKGSGSTLSTISNSGIAINGDTISGLSLGANEFLLITLD